MQKLLDLKNGAELNEYNLDCFINYFAPSVPKTPKDSFEWVAKAVADHKDIRTYLRYVYVENGKMVATDGRRLHLADTVLKDGFYCPKTRLLVDVDAKYPQYQRVIPKRSLMTAAKTFELNVTHIKSKETFYYMVSSVAVNKEYLDDAMATPEKTFYDSVQNKNISGDCVFGEFVIMGMRV